MKKFLVLIESHLAAATIGFAAGVYFLPILTAPPAPTASEVEAAAGATEYSGEFRRDLRDSDALHWGEGTVYVGRESISLRGSIAPGPAYKLYLSPEFVETEVPYTVDVEFDIIGFSNNPMEMINLQHAATVFFKKNKELLMDLDSTDPSVGRAKYEMDLTTDGDFKRTGQPNNSNLMSFSGRMVIRGFDVDVTAGIDSGGDIAGVPKNEVINRGFTSDEDTGVELDPPEQIGINSDPLVVRSIKSPGGC